MSSEKDRLWIEKGDRDIYTDLENRANLKGLSHTDVFCLAMALGFKNGIRTSINTKDGLIRFATVKEKEWRLIKAIAIAASDDLSISGNLVECVSIASEFANAGLQLLQETIRSTKTDELETIIERAIMEIRNELNNTDIE